MATVYDKSGRPSSVVR